MFMTRSSAAVLWQKQGSADPDQRVQCRIDAPFRRASDRNQRRLQGGMPPAFQKLGAGAGFDVGRVCRLPRCMVQNRDIGGVIFNAYGARRYATEDPAHALCRALSAKLSPSG